MALPTTVSKEVRVESVVEAGWVFIIHPLSLSKRPEVRALGAISQLRLRDIRNKMNDVRQEIDFSSIFDPDDCMLIKELSSQLNDDEADPLTPDELDLVSKADVEGCVISTDYQDLALVRQRVRQEGEIKSIAFFLTGVEVDGELCATESYDEAVSFVNTLDPRDFEKLNDAADEMLNVTPETEKNLEAQSTSS